MFNQTILIDFHSLQSTETAYQEYSSTHLNQGYIITYYHFLVISRYLTHAIILDIRVI